MVAGVSLFAADEHTGFPHSKQYLEFGYQALKTSFDTGTIAAAKYDPVVAL